MLTISAQSPELAGSCRPITPVTGFEIQFTFPQERPFRRRHRRRPPKTRPLRAGKEWQVNPLNSHSDKSSLALAAATHASLSLFCADDLAGLFPPRTVNSAFRNVLSSVAGLFVAEVSGGLQVGYNKWVAQKRGMAQGKRRGGVGEITGRTAKLSRGRSSMVPLTQVVAPFSSLKGTRICGKEEVRSDSQGR